MAAFLTTATVWKTKHEHLGAPEAERFGSWDRLPGVVDAQTDVINLVLVRCTSSLDVCCHEDFLYEHK